MLFFLKTGFCKRSLPVSNSNARFLASLQLLIAGAAVGLMALFFHLAGRCGVLKPLSPRPFEPFLLPHASIPKHSVYTLATLASPPTVFRIKLHAFETSFWKYLAACFAALRPAFELRGQQKAGDFARPIAEKATGANLQAQL